MTQIDTKDKQNIQKLLNQAKDDKNAAAELLKLYRFSMLNEARLYLDDSDAKDAVLRTFRNIYTKLDETDAAHIESWLNRYVQEECISRILPLHAAVDVPYTDADEKPNTSLRLPYGEDEISKMLRSALKKLDPSERLVSVLKYRDQLSFEEIAARCNTSEPEVKSVLSSAKKQMKVANAELDVIFAMVNKLYPFYEEKTDTEEPVVPVRKPKTKEELEEEEFNTAVQELKNLFDTKAVPINRITDRDIDDSEDSYSENIDNTFEMRSIRQMDGKDINDTASSAKMIMAAAMSADPDEKVSEKEYNPRRYWLKRAVIFGLIALLAIAIGVVFAMIRSNQAKNPSEPDKTAETETVVPEDTAEETDTPEPTEEATPEPTPEEVSDGSTGTITILVTDLSIRSGPGVNYIQVGMSELDQTYKVFETAEADGYTWYRVDNDQWIPDLSGQFVSYSPKSE